MKLFQMQYFQAVCRYNSVTKAAKMLHVSQSSISAAIGELEAEFGVGLFSRVKQRLILTSEGEYFLKNVNEILENTHSLEQKMLVLGQNQNHLRIAATPIAGAFAFVPLYLSYTHKNPSTHIQVFESNTRTNLLGVADETFDIVLATTTTIENNQLDYLALAPADIVFCVSPQHRLAHYSEITFEDLRDEPIVLWRNGSKHNTFIYNCFEEIGVSPNVVMYSGQIHTVHEVIASAQAGAFVFDGVAKLFPDYVALPIAGLPRQTVFLVWKKEQYINNRARHLFNDIARFIAFAREYAADDS